ncbi:MAG: hypothetical protein ACUVRZ_05965 [Desulfobacca sp.]|uniref:hypothetical protein n=1 Tax=Desulfobacca sp. TaxID=2067990 RepID=UPI00404AA69F
MTDFDHTLNILKFHLKKEIIDNYFAERTFLEDDLEALLQEEKEFEAQLQRDLPIFAAFYQLLGTEGALTDLKRAWGVPELPFRQECQQVPPAARQAVLERFKAHGWTARGRRKNQLYELYEQLRQVAQKLRQKQLQVAAHCQLYNEDVQKFNANYDFNLIASQVEALDGAEVGLESGLSAADREAMAMRMRLRQQPMKACLLVTLPELPPLAAIKKKLSAIAEQYL